MPIITDEDGKRLNTSSRKSVQRYVDAARKGLELVASGKHPTENKRSEVNAAKKTLRELDSHHTGGLKKAVVSHKKHMRDD